MSEKKVMALVAHDKQKTEMVEWVQRNQEKLEDYKLVGTDGTAELVNRLTDLKVENIAHGPKGGDILIAAEIIKENIDILIFFIDMSSAHAHEHDIQSLIRTAVYNVPFAPNQATADLLACS